MRRPAAVRFHGRLDEPVELTVAQLRDLPAHQVQVSFDCLTEGEQRHGFEGRSCGTCFARRAHRST